MSQACLSHITWPKAAIQIARVMSANMTHWTKILVVNLMEYIPTAIWCWARGGKRTTLQRRQFWFVPWQLQ
jgi:hypothetical protein